MKNNNAKYHHNCFSKYNESKLQRFQNTRKRSNEKPAEVPRTKRIAKEKFICECVFCEESEKDLGKLSSSQKKNEGLHAAGELHTTEKNANIPHVKKISEQWIKMALALNDNRLISKINGDVRANEIYYHSKCLKSFHYRYEKIVKVAVQIIEVSKKL